MGKFIFLMLALFTIGCLLYGITAGVQFVRRGFASVAETARGGTSGTEPLVASLPANTGKTDDAHARREETSPSAAQEGTSSTGVSPMQRSIDELRALFALYQQGALTQEEFEGMKRNLLT